MWNTNSPRVLSLPPLDGAPLGIGLLLDTPTGHKITSTKCPATTSLTQVTRDPFGLAKPLEFQDHEYCHRQKK